MMGIKICRWLQRHLSAAHWFDVANIEKISDTAQTFAK
jgi:hypothetical protein